MSTTASIAAKGTKTTGLTEDIAKRLHDSLGKTVVAIVEISSEARTEKRNGDEQVKLAIGMIEVAPDGLAADHVRELARSFHYERQLATGQPTLDEGTEPKVEDVLAAGQKHRSHPYLASTLSTDDTPVCDVCGQHEGAVIHTERKGLDDPFAIPDGEDTDPNADRPHVYVPNILDAADDDSHGRSCAVCGGFEDAPGVDHLAAEDRDGEECPHPGCLLDDEHDGDHAPATPDDGPTAA